MYKRLVPKTDIHPDAHERSHPLKIAPLTPCTRCALAGHPWLAGARKPASPARGFVRRALPRALLRLAPLDKVVDAGCPAEAGAALGNADAASAVWLISITAVESSLLKEAEQSNHVAEGAACSAAN